MNLTIEQREGIEKYAALLMKPEEVAAICEIDYDEFYLQLKDKKTDIYHAFYKGLYSTVAELRETIIAQAKAGSSPAQTQAIQFISELQFDL